MAVAIPAEGIFAVTVNEVRVGTVAPDPSGGFRAYAPDYSGRLCRDIGWFYEVESAARALADEVRVQR